MLDVHVHQLLLYAIFGEALVAFLEVFNRGNIILELLRCALTILQGSWFWQVDMLNKSESSCMNRCLLQILTFFSLWAQIGFVLYPPQGPDWDMKDHGNAMFVTMCYSWHLAFALLVVGVLYCTISW